MEVIRECDIFNDDSAEVIEVEESRKTNNCKVIEEEWYNIIELRQMSADYA